MDCKIQTSLITKTLAVAITAAMASTVQAASTEQQQIQELRQEVQALKALIQHQTSKHTYRLRQPLCYSRDLFLFLPCGHRQPSSHQ